MRYPDRAKYHLGAEEDLDHEMTMELAATHMGMYVHWAVLRGLWVDESAIERGEDYVENLRSGRITGRDLVLWCDGTLGDWCFVGDAVEFTDEYYNNYYYADYVDVLADHGDLVPGLADPRNISMYKFANSARNIELVCARLDERLAEFRSWAVEDELDDAEEETDTHVISLDSGSLVWDLSATPASSPAASSRDDVPPPAQPEATGDDEANGSVTNPIENGSSAVDRDDVRPTAPAERTDTAVPLSHESHETPPAAVAPQPTRRRAATSRKPWWRFW